MSDGLQFKSFKYGYVSYKKTSINFRRPLLTPQIRVEHFFMICFNDWHNLLDFYWNIEHHPFTHSDCINLKEERHICSG